MSGSGAIHLPRISKPRCFMVHALAPAGVRPAEANTQFNAYVGDPARGLVLFHDHYIGQPGGLAIFFAEQPAERQALTDPGPLAGWHLEVRPLIYSYSPGALDEQMAYTQEVYRGANWEQLRRERRPRYGNPGREAETAAEEVDES